MAARPVNPIHWLSGRTAPALSRPPGRSSSTGGKARHAMSVRPVTRIAARPANQIFKHVRASEPRDGRANLPRPQRICVNGRAVRGGRRGRCNAYPDFSSRRHETAPLAARGAPLFPWQRGRRCGTRAWRLRRPAASHLPSRRRRAGLPHVEPRQRRRPRPAGPPPRFLRRAVLTRSAAAADTGRRRVRGGF